MRIHNKNGKVQKKKGSQDKKNIKATISKYGKFLFLLQCGYPSTVGKGMISNS